MTENIMNNIERMPDSISDDLDYEESYPEPEEPEFERDTSLVDVLKDIATGLGEDFLRKPQA